jgi:hypothetical protein
MKLLVKRGDAEALTGEMEKATERLWPPDC